MPRPQTKPEFIQAANDQFEKLLHLISALSEAEQAATFHFDDALLQKEAHWARDKNLRDVLIHLYEWHQLLLNWVKANRAGENKPFLPAPYNWRTYGAMNIEYIWQKHQTTPLEEAKTLLKQSHAEVLAMIELFSNDELFAKKHFSWTGGTNLGSYCVSATSSHYDWAIKKIKAHIKTLKAK